MKTEKPVDIKISNQNLEYYSRLGYKNLMIGIKTQIKSKDVAIGVSNRIYVICQYCGQEKFIKSQNYHNQIKKHNFYVCQKCNNFKVKITNLSKYGTECCLQNQQISEKTKRTMIDNYGVDNISKLNSVREEKRTNFTCENFKMKAKKTWLEKYGVDNPSKSDDIKLKKQNTCLLNYGVDNPSQSPDIFESSQKSGKKIKKHDDFGIYYRGTYEKDFLDFCFKNEISVEKGPTIKYLVGKKIKFYHSDFYIKKLDLICEIKSSYYYNKYLEQNLLKEEYSKREHNFIFIVDKDYTKLLEFLSNYFISFC